MPKENKRQKYFKLQSGVGLDALYMLHKNVMYRVALKALDKDEQKAQAVLKDAFRMLGRHLGKIRDENSEHTKVMMVAAVKSVLGGVYNETRIRIGIPDRYENPRATRMEVLRINQILGRNELVANLAQYVEKLSFQEKEMIFYTYFAKWSQAEIASHMGISAHEVEPRLFRAKKKIAQLMTDGTLK